MELQELSLEKLPPQNLEAEMAALGSMLLEENAVAHAAELVTEDAFYKDSHRKIFAAMMVLYSENKPVDLVTLTDELKRRGHLENVGGPSALAQLTAVVPTAANVTHYCRIVKEKSLLRNLISAATQIITESYDSVTEADALVDKAESLIFEVAGRKIKGGFQALRDIIKSSMETIEHLYERKGYITGLSTGFEDLDHLTGGLQASDLIVVAGRPSMGKSAFALSIAEHAVLHAKVPTAVFSLEMSKEHLAQRLLCSYARVNSHNVRRGVIQKEEWRYLTSAAGKLFEAPLYIDDSPGASVLELRAKARRLKAHHNIGLIIVDYLQLMEAPYRSDNNRQQEISVISRQLKALARELNVPLIAVSQLSRAPERRETFRPRLSDLRESGAIEQDADVVLLLFRDEYYNPTDENRGMAEIIIAKQRNGPVDTMKLAFLKEFVRFENLSTRAA